MGALLVGPWISSLTRQPTDGSSSCYMSWTCTPAKRWRSSSTDASMRTRSSRAWNISPACTAHPITSEWTTARSSPRTPCATGVASTARRRATSNRVHRGRTRSSNRSAAASATRYLPSSSVSQAGFDGGRVSRVCPSKKEGLLYVTSQEVPTGAVRTRHEVGVGVWSADRACREGSRSPCGVVAKVCASGRSE